MESKGVGAMGGMIGKVIQVQHEDGRSMGFYRVSNGPGNSLYLWPEKVPENGAHGLLVWGDPA